MIRKALLAFFILTCCACTPVPVAKPPTATSPPARPACTRPAPPPVSSITVDGKTVTVEPGKSLEVVIEESKTNEGMADGGKVDVTGEKIDNKVAGTPGHISLGSDDDYGTASSDSGGIQSSYSAIINSQKGSQWLLYLLGGLLVAAGIAWIIYVPAKWKMGAGAIGGGLGIIACGVLIDVYPWVFLVALGLGAAIAAWMAWDHLRGTKVASKTGEELDTHMKAVDAIVLAVSEYKRLGDAKLVNADGTPKTAKQMYDDIKRRVRGNINDADYEEVFGAIDNAKERAGAVVQPPPTL